MNSAVDGMEMRRDRFVRNDRIDLIIFQFKSPRINCSMTADQ